MPGGIRVNLSDVSDAGFDPVPTGKYAIRVYDGEIKESGPDAKHPGSVFVAWEHTIAAGDFENRHLWDNTIISHGECGCSEEEKFLKGLFKIKMLLSAVGKWSQEELDADDFDWEIEDVVGGLALATVQKRDDPQYGESNTIKAYKKLDQDAVALSGASSLLPS